MLQPPVESRFLNKKQVVCLTLPMTGGKIQCMTPEMLIPPVPVFYKPEIEPGIVVCQLVTRVLFFFSEKRNCPDKPAVEKIFQYL